MKIRYPSLLLAALLVSPFLSGAQIIDQIKSASDEHSSSSSSSGSSDVSDSYSNDYYAEPDLITYFVVEPFIGSNPLFDRTRDPNRKYNYFKLHYRQSIDPRRVVLSVPECQATFGNYYMAVRINALIEPRAKDVDRYSTFDWQFLGFQTRPDAPVVFNLSTGILSESYSGNTYWEFVSGLGIKLNKQFTLYGEGRYCQDNSVIVRTEATVGTNLIVYRNKNFSIDGKAFFTTSMYYEEVPVEGFGLGLGVSF
ncbi:MAG: hypothetical protein JJ975_13380 [Bacteroidia bacterium]|nr:hypothetical protein [Bacteroidia bacterium]